jgi:hypothetical protein
MENSTPLFTLSLPDFGLSPISSTVSATKSSSGVNIHIWAEEFIDPPKNIGSFPESFTWKEFAKILANLNEGFIGEDAIDKVVVTGIAGLRAECLKYAWASENNGSYPFDYTDLLNWTLSLEENTIDYLDAHFDFSIEGNDISILLELKEYIFDDEARALAEDILEKSKNGGFASIVKMIEAAKVESENKRINEKEEESLIVEKFAAKIEEVSNKYSDVVGGNIAYRPPSDRLILTRWLKKHVIDHGEMPTGRHCVEVTWWGRQRGPGVINFDE